MSGWKLLHILTPDWWACSASLSQPCHIFIGPETLWWWELYFQLFFLPRKIILLEKKILMDSSSGLCLLPPHGLIWFCLPFSFYLFFFFLMQKNWPTVNWTWQRWHSLKLGRSRSCRLSWKLSTICSDPMAGQSSGMLTVRTLTVFYISMCVCVIT